MEYAQLIVFIIQSILTVHLVTSQEQEIHLEYSIYEESQIGSFVGDVATDAAYTNGFSFGIIRQRSQYPDYFSISNNGGILTTSIKLDRDTIHECEQQQICTLVLFISAQDDADIDIIQITVTVLDVNDNPPTFSQPQIVRTLPENTPVGSSIQIEPAEDPDSPEFSISGYELLTGAPHFSLRTDRNTDSTFDLWLILEEPLDREEEAHYPITIAAYDGNINPGMGILSVDVVITDVNDNSPIFSNDSYQVTIPEDVQAGRVIITVTATDDDEGINGQIVYAFTERTQRSFGDIFSINNQTGAISVFGQLSHDQQSEYTLGVTARDMNPVSLPASTRVVVAVQDVNDHAPGMYKCRNSCLFSQTYLDSIV